MAGSALWQRWVHYCGRMEDPRPQALVRILAPSMIVLDLTRVIQLGLFSTLFSQYDDGGLNRLPDSAYILSDLFPYPWIGQAAAALTLGCMIFASLGVFFRPAVLLGVLAYAQVGHLYAPGDRAIDRILRTVLLIFFFSQAHHSWSLRRGPAPKTIPAWPADLVRYLLVIVYLSAGLGKLLAQPGWLAFSGTPVLYRVMVDPTAAHMDPVAMLAWEWPLRIMGWGTIVFELSAGLILTRFAPYWALIGVTMHLGIFYAMDLGIFSWGMLSLYPLLFATWITPSSSARSGNAGG